jgi:hypothetical protein
MLARARAPLGREKGRPAGGHPSGCAVWMGGEAAGWPSRAEQSILSLCARRISRRAAKVKKATHQNGTRVARARSRLPRLYQPRRARARAGKESIS